MFGVNAKKSWDLTGTNDGDVLGILSATNALRRFVLDTVTGSVRVFPSVDGTNFAAKPLVLSMEPNVDAGDNVTETAGTFVAVTTAGRLAYFYGEYKAIKILQKGATAAHVRVLGTPD